MFFFNEYHLFLNNYLSIFYQEGRNIKTKETNQKIGTCLLSKAK